jgi:branched-chain amino acid transport system substrate-binding protein
MLRKTLLGILIAGAAVLPARADMTIAVVGPMTGPYAVFGDQMKRGADWVVRELNAKGGVNGQKLALTVGDDACDPKQAVAVANLMAGKHVPVVIGHYCSGSSIPASDVYGEYGILQISPASTNPSFTERKMWNVFRTCGRDDKQGVTAGAYIAKAYKDKRIAVLHDKSAYGKGLADEMKKELNKRGVKEALYDAYNPGEKDYTALVTRLKAGRFDVVYIGGYHTEVGLILRQAKDANFAAQFISGDANATDELWSIAGNAANGFLMTFGPDPRKNPAAKATVEAMLKEKFDPEGYTLYTVAAVQVWAEAVKKAGSTDAKKVAAAMHNASFDTVIGKLTLDAKGDIVDPKYVFYVWKDGKYSEAGF